MFHTRSYKYSIIRRITTGMAVVYMLLLILALINGHFVINTLRQNICSQLSDSLSQGDNRISVDLYDVSSYILSFAMDTPNLSIVEKNLQDSSYFSSLHMLQNELKTALTSMSMMQGLFVFPTTSKQFIYASADSANALIGNYLTDWFREQLDAGTLSSYGNQHWFAIAVDEHFYLMRILKVRDSYVGAWTDFTMLLSRVDLPNSLEPIILFSYDEDSCYTILSAQAGYTISSQYADQGYHNLRLDEDYIVVGINTSYTKSGAIFLLVLDSRVTKQLEPVTIFFIITGILFVLLAAIAAYMLRRYLQTPLAQLQNSLVALRSGDFSVRLPNENTSSEFSDVNLAFNQMVERITTLKINVYEEKMNQQLTEMQALKNQIAPHFLINCLNTIYHMSVTGNLNGIQHITVYLGEHLRYALSDASTVPLHIEIEKVVNYVELSKVRFPGNIVLDMNIGEDLQNAAILPMILMFQVENIIKYEVVNGEIIEIHIEINRVHESSQIHFCIWDTGNGYSEKVLARLQTQNMLSQSDGHNIGTKNIFQRLHLMFGDSFSMNFTNRPGAGAQVDIVIPFQIYKGERI